MNGNICAIFILYLQNLFVNNGEKHEKAWMGPFQLVIHVVQTRYNSAMRESNTRDAMGEDKRIRRKLQF